VWNGVCGKSKDLDESVVSEYKTKLLELISPYEPKNIYNADKTGFFFRALPTKSLREKSVPGLKCPKKDLQCVIIWEYSWRNGKTSCDWKSSKPRCFKNLKINNLPVIWKNNKKASMIEATMEEWLYMFNAKMKKENTNATHFS
jgi:hypothetical protein